MTGKIRGERGVNLLKCKEKCKGGSVFLGGGVEKLHYPLVVFLGMPHFYESHLPGRYLTLDMNQEL